MTTPNTDIVEQGNLLLALARAAIAREFGVAFSCDKSSIDKYTDWLRAPGASFVTLMRKGELRGCIGSLEALRSLLTDVEANARAAAFSDPRFAPLAPAELNQIDIEVSVLSPLQPLDFTDEADALTQLRRGIDGVVFEYGNHRSTFLPQVWQQLPDAREFMAHLKAKAGLPTNFWADTVQLFRYSVLKWKEQ